MISPMMPWLFVDKVGGGIASLPFPHHRLIRWICFSHLVVAVMPKVKVIIHNIFIFKNYIKINAFKCLMFLANYQMSLVQTGETVIACQQPHDHVHLPIFFICGHWVKVTLTEHLQTTNLKL